MKGSVQWALTLLMAVLSTSFVQAQERTYSGTVLSGDGQPIIGAGVEVIGTTTGTATGIDGTGTGSENHTQFPVVQPGIAFTWQIPTSEVNYNPSIQQNPVYGSNSSQ